MNTIDILKTHNAWCRGDDTRSMDDLGFNVTELGVAIDDAIRIIDERDQLRAELEECTRAWALTTSELEKERERGRQAMEVVKAVAHIGIDFGYGVFELEPTHIDQARKLYDSALSAGEGWRTLPVYTHPAPAAKVPDSINLAIAKFQQARNALFYMHNKNSEVVFVEGLLTDGLRSLNAAPQPVEGQQ